MINHTGECILSIVMITIPERALQFYRLKAKIMKQIDYCRETHPTLGDVELVIINSKKFTKGGESIGVKRTNGLRLSKGKYVCWLDDDDDISPDYIETLLRLALWNKDVLVFNNISRFDNFWALVQMNLDFKQDEQAFPGIIKRRPYHVCGWRRELLNGISFPDLNWDEDTAFIEQALKVCKTQSKTEAVLHEYNRGKRENENWRR